MRDLLIVDGYNLIHSSDEFKALLRADLESARARLVEDVSAYSTLSGSDAVVVFDASRSKGGGPRHGRILDVEVVFTKEGETADEAIERLAHRWRDKRRVRVATSDYAQQQAVFAEGVLRMSARELLGAMADEAKEAAGHRKTGRGRLFVEDRIDEEVRGQLRRFMRGDARQ